MGSAERVAWRIVEHLTQHFPSGANPRVVFRNACDIEPACRAVLLEVGRDSPAHVHGDLLHRAPEQ
eukprot:4782774-Alexandrium_andersonii.AAC.1